MKKIFLIIVWIITYSNSTFSQLVGTAFNINYIPEEHGFYPQNMDVIQDNRGVLYFGGSSGVTEFDGINWKLIETLNKYPVRSLAKDGKGRIYVGCHGDFGYLAPDIYGDLKYYSICSKLDSSITYLPIITDIKVIKDEIFFNGNNTIFKFTPYSNPDSIFDGSLKSIENIKTYSVKKTTRFIFTIDNCLYISDVRNGLYKLVDDTLLFVKNSDVLKEKVINSILKYGENKLLIAFNDKLCIFDSTSTNSITSVSDFKTEADSFFIENTINRVISIPNLGYSIATKSKGIIIINHSGKIVDIFNQDNGLNDNTVWNQYYNDGILWLALNVGITKLEISSPFRFLDKNNNIDGVVLQAIKDRNTLYLTTFSNVMYNELNMRDSTSEIIKFKPVFETTTTPWYFEFFNLNNGQDDSTLIVGKHGGIFVIDKNYSEMISENTSFCLKKSDINASILYSGGTESLTILNYSEGSWKSKMITGLKGFISSIIEKPDGNLWLGTELNGVYFIKKNSKDCFDFSSENNYSVIHYDTIQGLPSLQSNKVYKINDEYVFATQSGLYKFNNETENFYNCNDYGDYFGKEKNSVTSILIEKNGNIRINGRYILTKQNNNTYILDSLTLKRTSGLVHTFDYQLSDSVIIFGTTKGLFIHNLNILKDNCSKYNTLIRKVSIGQDSVIFFGTNYIVTNDSIYSISLEQSEKSIPKLKYEDNSIVFEYIAPFFENENDLNYYYYLEGYDKNWSVKTLETKKEYTNLREGDYIFYVKAVNTYNAESSLATYKFTVLPPWYRTYWAYILYLLFSLIFIYIILKLNSKRLKDKNIALEKIIKIRTHEISEKNEELHQQNEEIFMQSKRLESINIELEKLSIVARETDNAIIIIDNLGKIEWINEGFTRLYGYNFEEFIEKFGENFIEIVLNEDVKKLFNKGVKKESIIYESETITKNGEKIYVQTTATPIFDFHGNIIKLIIIDSDIRKLKKAENEILEKSNLIELQNETIKGSIKYAQTIQSAILPQNELMDIYFENFIIYKPKDIVSGDFYWLSSTFKFEESKIFNKTRLYVQPDILEKEISLTWEIGESIIFSVVDCTGHGVPGAFMSLISSRILSEIVNERNIYDPKDILTLLDKNLNKALQQQKTNNKDGMDISICLFSKMQNDEFEVVFSGAKSSIMYYKQTDKELIKIEGERRNIGGISFTRENQIFTNKNIKVRKSDIIYFSTDGFVDQCNQERNRFGTKRLMNFLLNNINKSLEEQKEIINNELISYQGDAEQRDDITFIGIKLK